jgi:hypothetical protein
MPWYLYTPGLVPNISDPNQYGPPLAIPPNCPSPKNYLCAIQATDNSGHPWLLGNITLFIEIANALNTRMESVNVKLRPTLYPI